MQVIFNRETAKELSERYTVLELETFEVNGKFVETFCVIPAEKIALTEISTMEHTVKLHNQFLDGLRRKDYKFCMDLYIHLIGKFGGELDSFYEEVIKRTADESSET